MIKLSNMKSENGITLLTLMVTVIMLAILTVTIAMNTHTSMQLSNLTKLQNDVEALSDRIASYYVQYGELPIYDKDDEHYKVRPSEITDFGDRNPSDDNNYYTIDLSKLSSLSLNYRSRISKLYINR